MPLSFLRHLVRSFPLISPVLASGSEILMDLEQRSESPRSISSLPRYICMVGQADGRKQPMKSSRVLQRPAFDEIVPQAVGFEAIERMWP